MAKKVAVLAVNPVNGFGLLQYLASFLENGITYKVYAVADSKAIKMCIRDRDTTMQMYEQWREQQTKLAHQQLEALLRWAAMLHEVGLNINHSGFHRHSAYIMQNSDLPGFH